MRGGSRPTMVLLALMAASPARGETIPPAWAAVGRITYGTPDRQSSGVCTATLIAPDLILTAGHCVRGGAGDPVQPRTVLFAAGWRDGASAVPLRRGTAILGIDGGAPGGGPKTMADDLALVRLDAQVDGVAPLPLAEADPGMPPWRLMAFRRDAPGVPVFADCRPVMLELPVIGLDCPVASGNSGGPLIAEVNGRWHLVAVMVAENRAEGPVRGLAVVPPEALRDLLR